MRAIKPALALAALSYASGAFAQSTSTSLDMGGGMTHVDTMGPNGAMSSSNCMNMGGGMTTCNTMDMGQPQRTYPTPDISRSQTNRTTLGFVGDLIARSQERSFQKKVEQMLSAGDCRGAANLAFAHQRFDMSNQIRRSCAANSVPDATETITAEQFMAGQPLPPAGSAQSQGSQQPSTAFNLWCEGTETKMSKAGLQEIRYTRLYRINLENGRYCDGDCATTQVLSKVDPYRITFYEGYGPTGYGSEKSINRENGELVEMAIRADGTSGVLAKCERRPFSGFPQQQF